MRLAILRETKKTCALRVREMFQKSMLNVLCFICDVARNEFQAEKNALNEEKLAMQQKMQNSFDTEKSTMQAESQAKVCIYGCKCCSFCFDLILLLESLRIALV